MLLTRSIKTVKIIAYCFLISLSFYFEKYLSIRRRKINKAVNLFKILGANLAPCNTSLMTYQLKINTVYRESVSNLIRKFTRPLKLFTTESSLNLLLIIIYNSQSKSVNSEMFYTLALSSFKFNLNICCFIYLRY